LCTSNTVYGEVTAGGSFAVDNGEGRMDDFSGVGVIPVIAGI
jgi:hypothetical protein